MKRLTKAASQERVIQWHLNDFIKFSIWGNEILSFPPFICLYQYYHCSHNCLPCSTLSQDPTGSKLGYMPRHGRASLLFAAVSTYSDRSPSWPIFWNPPIILTRQGISVILALCQCPVILHLLFRYLCIVFGCEFYLNTKVLASILELRDIFSKMEERTKQFRKIELVVNYSCIRFLSWDRILLQSIFINDTVLPESMVLGFPT